MSLERLLALWRTSPNAELADAIADIGTHAAIAVRWDGLDGTPAAEAVPHLLDTVLAKGSVKGRERLDAVASWPRDPRIDRWVAQQYHAPPLTSGGARPFWVRLLPLAKRIVDTRAANTILAARQGLNRDIPWQDFLAGHIDRITPQLAAVVDVPFAAGTRDAIQTSRADLRARIAAAAPRRQADADALLAAVLANPADDAPRIVLGDVLHEQGDPRGELLALQLGKGDPKRERAIVKEHAAHLLGPLHAVLKDYTFARGFLSRATLKAGNARALETAIAHAVGHPLWATVEHLEGGTHELAMHPGMKSLRSLAYSKARLLDLAAHPNLVALTTRYSDDAWLTVADGLGFPVLRELAVHLYPRHATPLVDSPLVTRLAKLDLRVDVASNGPTNDEVFDLLRRIHRLHVPDVTLRLVRYRDKDWHSAYRFTPGTVTASVTKSNTAYEPLIRADLERATAILQNLGRTVTT